MSRVKSFGRRLGRDAGGDIADGVLLLFCDHFTTIINTQHNANNVVLAAHRHVAKISVTCHSSYTLSRRARRLSLYPWLVLRFRPSRSDEGCHEEETLDTQGVETHLPIFLLTHPYWPSQSQRGLEVKDLFTRHSLLISLGKRMHTFNSTHINFRATSTASQQCGHRRRSAISFSVGSLLLNPRSLFSAFFLFVCYNKIPSYELFETGYSAARG